MGAVGPEGTRIDKALRAHYADEALKQKIVRYLLEGLRPGPERDAIDAAVADYERMAVQAERYAERYEVDQGVALVRIDDGGRPFDKTELLLLGQKIAAVAVVVDRGNVTIAAPFDSGLNFVELFDLGGGMPTRVSVPEKRLPDVLSRIRHLLRMRAETLAGGDTP